MIRTGVMFSFHADDRIITRVVRVQHYDTDLAKVDEINTLSRRADRMSLEQMEKRWTGSTGRKGIPGRSFLWQEESAPWDSVLWMAPALRIWQRYSSWD